MEIRLYCFCADAADAEFQFGIYFCERLDNLCPPPRSLFAIIGTPEGAASDPGLTSLHRLAASCLAWPWETKAALLTNTPHDRCRSV